MRRKNTGALIVLALLFVIALLMGGVADMRTSFLALAAESQAIIIAVAALVCVVSLIVFIRSAGKEDKH